MSKTRERAATKEHSTQSKILDLETQLSRTTSEINQMRRSKEEVRLLIVVYSKTVCIMCQ